MSDHDAANHAQAGVPANGEADVKRRDDETRERDGRGERDPEGSLWTKVAVPLLIGIVAAGAGFFGAQSGANATLEAQQQQLISQHNDTVRTQRETIYEQYLQAANAYEVASSERYSECIGDKTCSASAAGWQNARFNYQGALNAVYVYGSSEAWEQTHIISSALPPSLGTNSGDTAPGKVNEDLFTSGYQDFLAIMCREVNPNPQGACG